MNAVEIKTPAPVMGIYDRKMWDSIAERQWRLQSCDACGAFQYPPAPGCAACLSMALSWKPVSGRARILSWTTFHRQYLPAYPAPYNVIAVRLAEGPVFISNLEGHPPDAGSIGQDVELVYATMPDGVTLPRFKRPG
jgi:uncharacterized OB-fold protein